MQNRFSPLNKQVFFVSSASTYSNLLCILEELKQYQEVSLNIGMKIYRVKEKLLTLEESLKNIPSLDPMEIPVSDRPLTLPNQLVEDGLNQAIAFGELTAQQLSSASIYFMESRYLLAKAWQMTSNNHFIIMQAKLGVI